MAIEHGTTDEQVAATFNVCVDFFFFQAAAAYLKLAGPDVQKSIERDPYPEVEHQSRRGYIFAQRPKSDNLVKENGPI